MKDETWQRMKELFGEASTLPEHERDAFLVRQCAGDEALLDRIRSLLKAHEKADEFLREPTFGDDADSTSDAVNIEPGTTIGPYRLLERIGEGGFGVVYMAEQQTPIVRRVALKIIKPGMDTKQVRRTARLPVASQCGTASNGALSATAWTTPREHCSGSTMTRMEYRASS